MNTIYKYSLAVKETQVIDLPRGADIIRVADVDGLFFLWAIVDSEAETEPRYLEFYKTGQPIHTPLGDLKFIGQCGMVIMQELMLYVFENICRR
jgi:hypothetical protein